MKQVFRIDENGYFVEPVLIKDDDEIPADCIETPFTDGMYKPKWTEIGWIEGATQEEIDEIKANKPEYQPTLEELKNENIQLKERLKNTENSILLIMDIMVMKGGV